MAIYDIQENYNADTKMNFNRNDLQKFIIDRGAIFNWEKSYLCTCRAETGSANINCKICGGTGIAYLPGKEVVAMIQSMSAGAKSTQTGINNPGTSLLTTSEEDPITFRDRITFTDRLISTSLMVKVTNSMLTHGLNLRYKVSEITHAVYGYPNPVELTGSELDVDYDKSILMPTKDMVGKFLSLNMMVSLRFYVTDIIHDGRYQYDKDPRKSSTKLNNLARQLVVTREDMYIPPIIDDGKVTPVEVDPKAKLSDERTAGFFG